MTYADDAATIRAALALIEEDVAALANDATAEVAALTAAVNARQSWIDGAKVDILALEEENAALKARIAELTNVTPPPVDPPPVVVPPTPVGERLSWAPPALTSPTTIKPTDQQGKIVLGAGKDYIIDIAGRTWKNTRGLWIEGGRNVVVIGGVVDVGAGYFAGGSGPGVMADGYVKRAAYILGSTGRVHLEGVAFTSPTGSLSEGINISAASATVTVQNCRHLAPLVGSKAANHADALQSWNGPRWLGVDGFTATTGYQGMFLNPHDTGSGPVDDGWVLRRVELNGNAQAKYILWKVAPPASLVLDRVFTSGGLGNYPNNWAWPGVVHSSAPAGKGYAATAGASYVSPGYV